MQNCAFGLNNLVKTASLSGSASFYAGVSAAKDFSPNQLATDQGNATAAFWSVGDGNTTAWFQAQWGRAQTMRAFFVGRTNLGQAATWQLTASSGGNTVYSASGSFATLGGVGPVQMVHVAPQDIQADTVKITVTSNGSVSESYISLSLAYIGPVWQPVRNMSTKSTTGLDSSVTVNTGMSGAEFVTPAWMRRKAVVDHESLDLADVPVLEQILLVGASGANVLFVPDPDADGPMLNLRSLFGRIQRGDLSNPYGAALRQQTSFTITERL